MERMTIGQVARMAKTSIDTIRFYEQKGLVPTPSRTESGYRIYGPDTVSRLQFIHNAKNLGFTLQEIREILAFLRASGPMCESLQKLAEDKLFLVKEKVRRLRSIQRALEDLIEACQNPGHDSSCPIIDVLEQDPLDGKTPGARATDPPIRHRRDQKTGV